MFPEGEGRNYIVTLKTFGHPLKTYPIDQTALIHYNAPVLTKIAPSTGSTTGGYTATITGTNMGVSKPILTWNGVPLEVISQNNGYHDSFSFDVPPGQGKAISIRITTGMCSKSKKNEIL